MIKGQVTFKSAFSKAEFEAIEIEPNYSNVLKATLKASRNEGILLVVDVTDADTLNAAIDAAREVALYIAKVLTFKFGMFHKSFYHVDDYLYEDRLLPDGRLEPARHASMTLEVGGNIEGWATLGSEQLTEVKTFLQNEKHPGFQYYELFYSALGLTDSLSRFMALYSIVLSLCQDKQVEVDKFILGTHPNVLTTPPTHRNKKGPETVYTRLRNQFAHPLGTTIEVIKSEMEQHLSGLVEITKEIISQQP